MFVSSDTMLNQVHELARWTLEAGVVDTLTDSNARERRPYECDGFIGGSNRALLQMDQMLNRHSYAWVLEVPTWPVEWQQMTPLLGYQDYMATGSTDLFSTFEAQMYERTQVGLVDSTGLVNTSTAFERRCMHVPRACLWGISEKAADIYLYNPMYVLFSLLLSLGLDT